MKNILLYEMYLFFLNDRCLYFFIAGHEHILKRSLLNIPNATFFNRSRNLAGTRLIYKKVNVTLIVFCPNWQRVIITGRPVWKTRGHMVSGKLYSGENRFSQMSKYTCVIISGVYYAYQYPLAVVFRLAVFNLRVRIIGIALNILYWPKKISQYKCQGQTY